MPAPLIIIDVQKGFVNDATRHLPDRVTDLQAGYEHVIATRFVNPEGSAHRRLMGWTRFAPDSRDAELAFAARAGALIIDKASYSGNETELLERLQVTGATEVHLCGIATDNCVLAVAVALFEAGLRPVVLADYCASHAGVDYHEWGLRILRRLIGEAQVVDGGPPTATA